MAASVAVEAVLLPVQALVFSRVTLAGIALNLIAVPMMAVAQIAGLAVVALDLLGASASWPAWAADIGRQGRCSSSGPVVEAAPWLSGPVRPPPSPVVAAYYVALAVATFARRGVRAAGIAVWVVTAAIIVAGSPEWLRDAGRGFSPAGPQPRDVHRSGHLRVTMLDVGQAEAILLEPPAGGPLLIDAGGSPFGSGLDIGARVVTPALWARGVNWLSALLVTHGDPDHLGGVPGVLAHMAAREAWLGIAVPGHAPGEALLADLDRRETPRAHLCGRVTPSIAGDVRWRVLHPPEPDWERPPGAQRRLGGRGGRATVRWRSCSLGDVGAEVERAIVPQPHARADSRAESGAPRQPHVDQPRAARGVAAAARARSAPAAATRSGIRRPRSCNGSSRLARACCARIATVRSPSTTDGRTLRWRTFSAR